MLLAEITGKRFIDFKSLDLEQLQLLVCRELGLAAVRGAFCYFPADR